jgi:hypothetical protein
MRNEEELLSIYPAIFALMNAGFTIKQITEDVNQQLSIKITYRQLLYLIQRVTNKIIHKEYDNIVVIDNLKDASDKKLSDYCVDFKGLLVTYKSAAHLTNPEYIITPKNITTIYSETSVIYAKRIIKLYHISDAELLQQHKIIYPKTYEVNLSDTVNYLNNNFNNEFAAILIQLRDKYINFLAKNIIGNLATT